MNDSVDELAKNPVRVLPDLALAIPVVDAVKVNETAKRPYVQAFGDPSLKGQPTRQDEAIDIGFWSAFGEEEWDVISLDPLP